MQYCIESILSSVGCSSYPPTGFSFSHVDYLDSREQGPPRLQITESSKCQPSTYFTSTTLKPPLTPLDLPPITATHQISPHSPTTAHRHDIHGITKSTTTAFP
eukprot:scaffold1969_cov191-Alexandrium_tamarense.AAC.19